MPLFAERPDGLRMAAFVGYEYPVAEHASVYRQLERLAATLGAELRVVHSVCADPSQTPADLRASIGGGLFVPQDPQIRANDVEHLRATVGERFDDLIESLRAPAACSAAAVINRPELQEACSATRWLRGWSPDLIVSHGIDEPALHALVASQLLDVPRLAMLDATTGETAYALLLPMHLMQCDAIWTSNDAVARQLKEQFAEQLDKKLLPASATSSPVLPGAALPQQLRNRLTSRRRPEQPSLGPLAAFRSKQGTRHEQACGHGFLVLGSERTGSNLLVGMLDQHEQLATASEVFNPRLIRTHVMPWLADSTADPNELMRTRRSAPSDLHLRLLAEGTARGAARTGFKLLYYHALIDDRLNDHLMAQSSMPIVHLLRRERLPRFVSLCRANQSDEWFAEGNTIPPPYAPLELDARELATDFTMSELFEARFRALLRNHRHVELDYADLCDDLSECSRKLSELFGVHTGTLTPRTSKTGRHDVRDSVANYSLVQSWLSGTRWSDLAGPTRAPNT